MSVRLLNKLIGPVVILSSPASANMVSDAFQSLTSALPALPALPFSSKTVWKTREVPDTWMPTSLWKLNPWGKTKTVKQLETEHGKSLGENCVEAKEKVVKTMEKIAGGISDGIKDKIFPKIDSVFKKAVVPEAAKKFVSENPKSTAAIALGGAAGTLYGVSKAVGKLLKKKSESEDDLKGPIFPASRQSPGKAVPSNLRVETRLSVPDIKERQSGRRPHQGPPSRPLLREAREAEALRRRYASQPQTRLCDAGASDDNINLLGLGSFEEMNSDLLMAGFAVAGVAGLVAGGMVTVWRKREAAREQKLRKEFVDELCSSESTDEECYY